jgi:hypothetical protein
MATNNNTNSSNQYNQGSMNTFQNLNSSFGNAISGEINNPYNNMAFNTQLQMQNKSNAAQGASQTQALQQRMQAMGQNPNSPLYASQLNKQMRQQSGNNANSYNNLLLQAQNLRQNAIGQAGAYKPLQTGQNTQQTQSGLGTWLPQVAGAALGAATGGMSGMFTGAPQGSLGGSGFFSGAAQGPQGMMNPNSGVSGANMGVGNAPDLGSGNPFMGQPYTPGGGLG